MGVDTPLFRQTDEIAYWDNLLAQEHTHLQTQSEWLRYMRLLYAEWVARHLRPRPGGRVLKTDAFEEMWGGEVIEALRERFAEVVVGDVAHSALRSASYRLEGHAGGCIQAAVQDLPFRAGSFDAVVSFSTLDHFADRSLIGPALAGLWRLTKPGGQLLLTLDNAANPVVRLRNALPDRLLQSAGVSPYRYGDTLGPRALSRTLETAGWRVDHFSGVLHSPRVLAVAASRWVSAGGLLTQSQFDRCLRRFDVLERLPTRMWTGYYLLAVCTRVS